MISTQSIANDTQVIYYNSVANWIQTSGIAQLLKWLLAFSLAGLFEFYLLPFDPIEETIYPISAIGLEAYLFSYFLVILLLSVLPLYKKSPDLGRKSTLLVATIGFIPLALESVTTLLLPALIFTIYHIKELNFYTNKPHVLAIIDPDKLSIPSKHFSISTNDIESIETLKTLSNHDRTYIHSSNGSKFKILTSKDYALGDILKKKFPDKLYTPQSA